jgi:hypothetical protein
MHCFVMRVATIDWPDACQIHALFTNDKCCE